MRAVVVVIGVAAAAADAAVARVGHVRVGLRAGPGL